MTRPATQPTTKPTTKPKDESPDIQIPEASLKSGLLSADLNVVDRYVTYWAGKLSEATEEQAILDARSRLVRGYLKYDSWQYQSAYVGRVTKALVPVLSSLDIRKQVNAALVLSQMRQVTVQPALELLVVSPNPALRLCGWTGYRRIRMLVLAQGKESVAVMLNALSKAAVAEDSGPVMSAILGMMYLEPDRPTIVSEAMFEETRAKLFDVFRQVWPRVCRKILDGDSSMVRAAEEGLGTLRRVAAGLDSENEIARGAVQMVLDLMWCAANSYVKTGQTPSQLAAWEALLRDCESAQNAITELRRVPITEALSGKADANRAEAVENAVTSWIRFLENANWPVQEPKFQTSPGPVTMPTTPD